MSRIVDPLELEPEALARLAEFADKDVLELGCGDGRASRRMAATAASVIAVDSDEAAIERARALGGPDGLTYEAVDALELELPASSVDLVLFSRSL